MIDVRRLRVLQAVIDTGSIAAAAAVLNYTPSAVSQQMSTLEQEAGVQLLERVGRGIRPTDAARLLYEHAIRVFASIDDAEKALAAVRAGHSGQLRIGAFPSASSSLIPPALASFRLSYPNILLNFIVAESDELVAGLRDGTLDVAVATLATPHTEDADDGLIYHHLLSDAFRIVLPRSHALASDQGVHLKSLATDDWVGINSSPGHCQLVAEEACGQIGFRPMYAIETDQYPTVLGLVGAGLGVALVPTLALQHLINDDVTVCHVKDCEPKRQVWATTRMTLSGQAPVRAMLACLKDAAAEFQLRY